MYNTHNPVFSQVCNTPDLYYREEIRNFKLRGEEDEAVDMQQMYNDYLIRHGRPKEVSYLDTPDIDRWRNELEEMVEWLDLQEWPQPDLNPQPDNVVDPIWPNMGDDMDAASEERWNHRSGRSTPTSGNSGL